MIVKLNLNKKLEDFKDSRELAEFIHEQIELTTCAIKDRPKDGGDVYTLDGEHIGTWGAGQ